VVDVADVFRRFGPSYQAAHGAAMPPSHRRAIADILACRTEALGGHLERCTGCGAEVLNFHACRNRSCPQCHGEQTRAWLEKRQAEMLPCPYFHVTVTVPEELRAALRTHQRDGYGALMTAAAEAIIEVARDPRYVGGTVGVLAVLHTWTQQLHFHPHVHCLVTGGGVSGDGDTWHPARPDFLVPTRALGKAVRGRFRAAFARRCPGVILPAGAWRKPWVVHITPWGAGEQAVLDYLARYTFRIALTNRRLVDLDEHTVAFQYTDRPTGSRRICRVSGHEFMRRYLQHVLPTGFHKVRYFGLWHPSKRAQAQRVRHALLLDHRAAPAPLADTITGAAVDPDPACAAGPTASVVPPVRLCPLCRHGHLVVVRRVSPIRSMGP
jgi:hypothetical protein